VEYGVSIGLDELMKARRIILAVTGSNKAEIIRKTVKDKPGIAVPSSLLINHPGLTLYLDDAAAALITEYI
jgi:6-phosphogluconolactonase/glucosamine-6-phosphate isomerase/deaminase